MPTDLFRRTAHARRIAPRAVAPEWLITLCVILGIALVGAALSRTAPVEPVEWVIDPGSP